MVLHSIWGHHLIRHATNNKALNNSQYAVPGQTCNNAVLNKVLFCDLSRQTLSPGILTNFDATAAFDRVIAGLSIITCKRLGLPLVAGYFMFNLLKNMHFHLVTGFGKSEDSFHNTENNVSGQGVLQGSSSAAPIFLLNSDVSLATYKEIGIGAKFSQPISGRTVTDHGVQFVDNTSQFLNVQGASLNSTSRDIDPSNLAALATNNAQAWSDCMWISGGQLNLDKFFYYAFNHTMDYKSNSIKCSTLQLNDEITIKNRDLSTHILTGVPPNEARRTLGVMLSPDGNGDTQIKITLKKAKEYFGKFINGTLPQCLKWIAVTSVIEPSIIYLLVTSSFSSRDFQPIGSITSQMKCLALGFSRKFPRAILHGPMLLGGIGIPSTSQKNTKDRLNYFLFNVRRRSTISEKIGISLIYSQIDLGSNSPMFDLPYESYGHLVTPSFCVQLWSELEPKGLLLRPSAGTYWTPTLLFKIDQFIMDIVILHYDPTQSAMINKCRIYLHLFSICNLLIMGTDTIHPAYLEGHRSSSRKSTITWPAIPRPPQRYWALWNDFITRYAVPIIQTTSLPWNTISEYHFHPVFYKHRFSTGLYTIDDELTRFKLKLPKHHKKQLLYVNVPYKCPLSFNKDDFYSVDTHCHNKGISYLGKWISPNSNSLSHMPPSLSHRFSNLHPSLHQICGSVILPLDNGEKLISQIRQNKLIFGSSDASFKNGPATHAWIIA